MPKTSAEVKGRVGFVLKTETRTVVLVGAGVALRLTLFLGARSIPQGSFTLRLEMRRRSWWSRSPQSPAMQSRDSAMCRAQAFS